MTTPIPVPEGTLKALRVMRLFHWRKYQYENRAMQHAESIGYPVVADTKRKQAAMHLGFVQSLNDFFDLGDTADNDDKEDIKVRRGKA